MNICAPTSARLYLRIFFHFLARVTILYISVILCAQIFKVVKGGERRLDKHKQGSFFYNLWIKWIKWVPIFEIKVYTAAYTVIGVVHPNQDFCI